MTQTSVYRSNANAWAGLSDVKTMRMRDYLDDHIIKPMRGETRPEDLVYSSGAVGIPGKTSLSLSHLSLLLSFTGGTDSDMLSHIPYHPR